MMTQSPPGPHPWSPARNAAALEVLRRQAVRYGLTALARELGQLRDRARAGEAEAALLPDFEQVLARANRAADAAVLLAPRPETPDTPEPKEATDAEPDAL